MSYKICAAFLSSVLLISSTFLEGADRRGSIAAGSNQMDNVVAEYLDGATENARGEDHRQVMKQALTDMLDLPVERLRERTYPDYEMRPDAWSITVILERYYCAQAPRSDDRRRQIFR